MPDSDHIIWPTLEYAAACGRRRLTLSAEQVGMLAREVEAIRGPDPEPPDLARLRASLLDSLRRRAARSGGRLSVYPVVLLRRVEAVRAAKSEAVRAELRRAARRR